MTLQSSLFRKLLLSSALLIALALVSAYFMLSRYVAERESTVVRQEMARTLRFMAPSLVANPPSDLEKWTEDADSATGRRVTVIDHNGVVLGDSRHDPETMENHSARKEVRAALAHREGVDERRSATLDVEFSYYAVPVDLPGHPGSVLRMAVPLAQVHAAVLSIRMLILRASAAAAVIALLLAYLIAHTFTRRVRRIQTYATELVSGDYSGTLTVESDDELGKMARSLRAMAEHFRSMMAQLAQESSRREAILSSMVEGVLAVDHDLRITFYNDAFARSVRARAAAREGTSVLNVVRDPALRTLLGGVVATGKPASERMSLLNAEGRMFEVQAAPLGEKNSTGALATFHDVTELERLERVRKDFVANVSHELRTPLAAIQGYTETLLDGALDDVENSRKFLEIIAAHTARLGNIAFDLLTLSEIEAERMPIPAERVSAVEIAENALHLVATQASERHVRAFLGDAEDVYIAGQKGRLERAISNLLLNGINYNHAGGEVRVDVRRVNGAVRISVTDDGIGISSQDIPRIFERFYRVDKARSRQTGGTGLGLSIVRNTVERAGGTVAVESQLGKGSVFTLVFPAA